MQCARRVRLEQQHDRAGARFDDARQRLRERMGVCPKDEFVRLSDDMDRAWIALDQAQMALDEHIRTHSCLAQGSTGIREEECVVLG